jgi:RNA polymerase sigma-70 factor (ECF subfamily)
MEALMDLTQPTWTNSQIDEAHAGSVKEAAVPDTVQQSLDHFNQLVMDYQDLVFNQAYRILGDPQAAEDAAQEAFILAYRKFHTYKGGSLRAWLLRIVTNLCYDEFRRQSRARTVALEPVDDFGDEIESPEWLADPAGTPEEAAENSELRDTIQGSINRLPAKNRIALVLIDVQGLDYIEAAEVMRCPVGTVKSRLARARLQMRAHLRGSSPFSS